MTGGAPATRFPPFRAGVVSLGPDNFDGIILTIHGLAWLTPENVGFSDPPREVRDAVLADYLDRSPLAVYTMIHLSKDWMFAPAFWRESRSVVIQ